MSNYQNSGFIAHKKGAREVHIKHNRDKKMLWINYLKSIFRYNRNVHKKLFEDALDEATKEWAHETKSKKDMGC